MTTNPVPELPTPEGTEELTLQERVVKISRVAKVVKGGRHLSFSAMVVVGDGEGHVGIGLGKADAVPDAVRKGAYNARKSLITVPLRERTIPHEVSARFGASQVMLMPAAPGAGVIAGGSVRAVVEMAGVKNIRSKARGSTNPINCVKAAFKALTMLQDPGEVLAKRRQLAEQAAARQQRRSQRKA